MGVSLRILFLDHRNFINFDRRRTDAHIYIYIKLNRSWSLALWREVVPPSPFGTILVNRGSMRKRSNPNS